MSFEAVPCRFRSSTGPNGETEYIGLLIRPAETTQKGSNKGAKQELTPLPPPPPLVPAVPPVPKSGANQAIGPGVRVLATGTPITVNGDTAPRYLVPANVAVAQLPLAPAAATWQQAVTPSGRGTAGSTPSTSFTTPPPNISSPQQPPRSLSVCSSSPLTASSPMSPPAVNSMQNGTKHRDQVSSRASTWQSSNDSSTTPDSGIQSVPGSPPSHHRDSPPTIEACTIMNEDKLNDDDDFTDMPRLIPVNQIGQEEDDEDYCLPGPSGLRDEHSTTGSECETLAPVTLSIHPHMDNAKISEQLIQLDPARAFEIATEIQKRIGIPVNHATPSTSKKRGVKKESSDKPKKRKSKGEEERKEEPKKSRITVESEVKKEQEEMAFVSRKQYRATMRRLMAKQLNEVFEKTIESLKDLHIGERERHGRKSAKGIKMKAFYMDWEALKKRRKRDEDKQIHWKNEKSWSDYAIKDKEEEGIVTSPKAKRIDRKRKAETPKESPEVPKSESKPRVSFRTPQRRKQTESTGNPEYGERKIDLDYEEIPRSVCEENLPGWRVPIVRCACTRGSCSSDAECINRALFVQCPSNCQAPMCINKKFWKEDSIRLLTASGPKSKKTLRTKTTRRAGEFLGEFAGEVIDFPEAERRYQSYLEKEEISRILCISSSLFIDATQKGNICRFVKHSCKPNSRLEVWSINGHLRAGLFSLYDLASNTEVTISMSGLLPVSRPCVSCQETDPKCCKVVKRSRNAALSNADPESESSIVQIDTPAVQIDGPEEKKEKDRRKEKKKAKTVRIFLPRNRRKIIKKAARFQMRKKPSMATGQQESLQKVLDGLELRIRRVDGSLPYKAIVSLNQLKKAIRICDSQLFQSTIENLLDKMDDDDLDRVYSALSSHYLAPEKQENKKKEFRGVREVDLSYLEGAPIGSYNPDEAWPKGPASKKDDAVRCECGSLEEDGKMLQCDSCFYWLHTDCIGNIESTKYYQCRLCSEEISDGIPSTDVRLVQQPEVRLEGCIYYKALVNNRRIQVRQFETVYMEKVESDEHKKTLKKLNEISERSSKKKKLDEKALKAPSPPPFDGVLPPIGTRNDLRIFRVVRLFVSPDGHRFVFGFYYARPHETICDPSKLFHRNEVFATPFYDTLPLDAVVGRCVVLDPDVWIQGRPTVPQFKEEDVLLCDYQIDKSQRSFEKIPARNRFPMNTQPYVFLKFDTPKQLVRNFTPFIVGERSTSRNSGGRSSRLDISRGNLQSKQQSMKRLESVVSRLKPNE